MGKKCKLLTVKEIHRANSKNAKPDDVILTEGDTLDYYGDKIVLSSLNYSEIFKEKNYSMSERRLSIVRITSHSGDAIWRTACFQGMKNVDRETVALPYLSMRELGVKQGESLQITRGCWMPYYWRHPNHAARISFRIGTISLVISVISLVVAIITFCI